MTLGCNIINRLVHEKLQEPLRAYLQLTHHTSLTTCNKIKVNLDPKHPDKKYAFAKSNRKASIMIPACTEMTVQATTVNLKQPFEAIVESNPFNLPAGIVINPTIQIVKGGQVNVQVGNTTNEDIYLPRNQKIAKVTLAEEVIPEYEMDVDKTGRKIVYLQEQQHQTSSSNSENDVPDLIWVTFRNLLKNKRQG